MALRCSCAVTASTLVGCGDGKHKQYRRVRREVEFHKGEDDNVRPTKDQPYPRSRIGHENTEGP